MPPRTGLTKPRQPRQEQNARENSREHQPAIGGGVDGSNCHLKISFHLNRGAAKKEGNGTIQQQNKIPKKIANAVLRRKKRE